MTFYSSSLICQCFGKASRCVWHSGSNVTSRVIYAQYKWVFGMFDDRMTFSLNADGDYSLKALKGNMSITLVQSAFLLLSAGLSVYQLRWKIKGLHKQGINFRSLPPITLGRKHHFFNAARLESSYIYAPCDHADFDLSKMILLCERPPVLSFILFLSSSYSSASLLS